MKIVADLHIHSHFSRATSKNLDFEHLWQWAQLKGVTVVGTGDIAHPGWLAEMRQKLEPAEDGLFRLKMDVQQSLLDKVPAACRREVRFLLAGEISNIYKRHDKVRKVHNVIFAPSLHVVEQIQAKLETIGNIRSDGRPILGLDSRDLLEIVLEIDERCHLIPAHIWTPWFSMLGSKSGFNTVEECFGDLTPHIFALETGLSSDPPMNRRVSMLDRYTLISSSDAHSPQKLAREATLLNTDFAYDALFRAIRSGSEPTFGGTIEFFPEEGKYHHDGHRKCSVNWHPRMTRQNDGLCSQCGKPVTVGVSHRVEDLADRAKPSMKNDPPYTSLIPLPEIISELVGVGVQSKKVQREYHRILATIGSELEILLETPIENISQSAGTALAEGIARMRSGNVTTVAGYDGEYGVIKLFEDAHSDSQAPQIELFADATSPPRHNAASQPNETESGRLSQHQRNNAVTSAEPRRASSADRPSTNDLSASARLRGSVSESKTGNSWQQEVLFDQGASLERNALNHELLRDLNEEQRRAVLCVDTPVAIVAGPGTGKTRTLTRRIAYLISDHGVNPASILAITFTNKAAAELNERLVAQLGAETTEQITAETFHALGLQLLTLHGSRIDIPPEIVLCGEDDRLALFKSVAPQLSDKEAINTLRIFSTAKCRMCDLDSLAESNSVDATLLTTLYAAYENALSNAGMIDFDDLIYRTVLLLERHADILQAVQSRYRWISVDEYQDVNFAQYRLLRLLTVGGANLCVIGDPDQAIYAFRGADRRHFLSFLQDYPTAQMLHLHRNYRSIQLILDASQQVIDKNPNREALRIWSDFVSETKPTVFTAHSDRAEAEYVVHQIEQMVGGTSYFSLDSGRVDERDEAVNNSYSFGDFAVLFRLGAQAQPLVEAFERSGIPFQCGTEKMLTHYDDVKSLVAHLRLHVNPLSIASWDRLLNHTEEKFPHSDLTNFVQDLGSGIPMLHALRKYEGVIRASDLGAVRDAVTRQAQLPVNEQNVVRLIEIATYTDPSRNDAGSPIFDFERVQSLRRRAHSHSDDLVGFLASLELESETDTYDPRADRVALMTLHGSKGLEFPVVFIVGSEEGLHPYQRTDEDLDEEEERRLFYVGMTRAKDKLIFTHAKNRFLFGQHVARPLSRFVRDVEMSLLELKESSLRRKPKAADAEHVQLTLL